MRSPSLSLGSIGMGNSCSKVTASSEDVLGNNNHALSSNDVQNDQSTEVEGNAKNNDDVFRSSFNWSSVHRCIQLSVPSSVLSAFEYGSQSSRSHRAQ